MYSNKLIASSSQWSFFFGFVFAIYWFMGLLYGSLWNKTYVTYLFKISLYGLLSLEWFWKKNLYDLW
jgi:hypothetical protein